MGTVTYAGRPVRVETSAEIIAKKMFHRGHLAKARDLFDLCAVAESEPAAIKRAKPFFERHSQAFLHRLHEHADIAAQEFEAIDRIAYTRSFPECMILAERILA